MGYGTGDISSPPMKLGRVGWCAATCFAVWVSIVWLPWPYLFSMAQAAGLAAGSSGLLALLATTICLVCLVCNSPSGSKGGSGFAVSAMGILAIMTIALTTGKLAADDHVSGTSAQYFTGQPVLMLPNVCSSIVATFKDAPRATWSPDRDIVVNGKSVLEGRAACDQLFNVVQVARL